MLSRIASFAILCAAMLPGNAATAGTVVSGSFAGTVTSGIDLDNIYGFGLGADLTGKAITGSFNFDASLFPNTLSIGFTTTRSGDGDSPVASSITTTINGVSVTMSGVQHEQLSLFHNPNTHSAQIVLTSQLSNNDSTTFNVATFFNEFTVDPANPAAISFSLSPSALDLQSGTISEISGPAFADEQINFDISHIEVGPALDSVPEPGTIGLFMFGLGGLACLRRRSYASLPAPVGR